MTEVRVLHDVWSMGIGGIETFLMGVARRLGRRGFRHDFLVHAETEGHHEKEIVALGGRVFRCPEFRAGPARLRSYLSGVASAVRAGGPYDVYHCHYDISGPSLFVAARARIPVRIVSNHSDAPELVYWPRWKRALLFPFTRTAMRRHATHGTGVSEPAAVARFGRDWRRDPRWTLQRCGIDVAPFRPSPDRRRWRAEQGLPDDALVLVHIGRFGPEKNHGFLLEIAAELKRRAVPFRLVLLGDGWPRRALAARATELGLSNEVLFPGYRTDVPDWLAGAADLLVFPSFYEGLPLAVIEAQAAGVPVLMSDRITPEAVVVDPLVRRLPLGSAHAWADAALDLAGKSDRPSAVAAWERVGQSPFNIDRAADAWETYYRRALADGGSSR